MKTLLTGLLLLMATSNLCLAQHLDTGGDAIRGGDDGLDYRLASAITLASMAFDKLSGDLMKETPADIYQFYLLHAAFLSNEIKKSQFKIRPEKQVTAMVGGVEKERKFSTDFLPLSDVLVSRELNINTSVAEMTASIIHEVGHHAGIHDENEDLDERDQGLFLNRFARKVLEVASQHDVLFQAKLYGNVSISEIISNSSGIIGLGVKRKVGKYIQSYDLDFRSGTLILRKRKAKDQFVEPPEPAYAKEMHERLPNVKFRIVDTDAPDLSIYAKVGLTSNQVDLFFEVNKNPITIDVPSLNPNDDVNYRVTFSAWTKDLFPAPRLVSITPVLHRKPQWKKTIEIPI